MKNSPWDMIKDVKFLFQYCLAITVLFTFTGIIMGIMFLVMKFIARFAL